MTEVGGREQRKKERMIDFWESPFKRLLVLVLGVLLGIGGWAYSSLDERKVDKETLAEIVRRLDEKIGLGFDSVRREIRAARGMGWE